jgi:hypothetical protein
MARKREEGERGSNLWVTAGEVGKADGQKAKGEAGGKGAAGAWREEDSCRFRKAADWDD